MASLWRKRHEVLQLIRFDRPYGTFLVMLPALWSLVLASRGMPTPHHLIVFILGAFLMRSCGCVVNDMADRKWDARVTRTRNRPLASGRLNLVEASMVLGLFLLFSFLLVLTLNRTTLRMSIAALILALFYPFTKRFFMFPQVVLGITFGFGVLMAWTAVHRDLSIIPLLLFLANVAWVTGYDTLYAMMDYEDDRHIGIQSTAIWLGAYSKVGIGLCNALMIFLLMGVGTLFPLGFPYFIALAGAGIAFAFQFQRLLPGTPSEVLFSMFKAQVWIGGMILVGMIGGM